ncbi:hypothetical protein L6654_07985 [Bradyrhizobium sp. WYCCWR 13023]|uniref:Uncharacterized protein n=1 Tax=Bradyrhizobium zhengyangense TaxID=2911009 RepID=A0A9X1R7S0_9BRAD|nr:MULTISPECIES: hypothetical protein [Bradyrhizobium]MCG2626562.1 hypothetical protein [Bradyrhizobium zhengyangense]MCG2640386.1 hypothetical protein [Bradyrhizobium zhengyangense]MCG2665665.1 hypothetical protein [Bradyrhizobium zhengyangense]MDA9524085.1 hypothetical protein [Bradyrhizobium sp. CCBAU 11434]
MASRTLISLLAFVPRRRIAATTILYGLSLAVRFTSATGEQMEIPAQSMQRAIPVMSIMTTDDARPYADWLPNAAQPVMFRNRWLPLKSSMSSCASR